MATGEHTWSCPACGRRVPRRVGTCHCGMTRERAEARAAAVAVAEVSSAAHRAASPARPRTRRPHAPLPRDVKALLAAMALAAVTAVGWLVFGPSPEPVAPVLGFVDAGPPPPPTPTPRPTPAFNLPWWR